MPKLTRPPYVLCHPGDNAGCGYHRIMRPLEILGRAGVCAGRADFGFLPDHMLTALKPDVVVWQRQNEDTQIEAMKNYRRLLPNAFFVYELDDALSAVPDKSWHKPYMPSNVDAQTAKAVAVCDVVTVTTHALARRMREICGENTKVRVVPNMLGKDDLERVDGTRKMAPRVGGSKLRVGWGGGIGHGGDLALLNKAFTELKDEVHWVFIGMQPEMPPGVNCEFRGAAAPQQYLQALASLHLDLMIAPLEQNVFNECKSNLRLIEGGACMYPVIASKSSTYETDSPPVYAYAETEGDWINSIRTFSKLSVRERMWHAEKMRRWVERIYIMDDHAEKRLQGWLPDNTKVFVPKVHQGGSVGKPIIVYNGPLIQEMKECGTVVKNFAEAAEVKGSSDLLYIRPSAHVTKEQIERALEVGDMRQPQGQPAPNTSQGKTASVSVMSNDGGLMGFPKLNQFMPIDVTAGENLDKICQKRSTLVELGSCCGPMVVLKRIALEVIGFPDAVNPHHELALIEWAVAAGARGFKNVGSDSVYVRVDGPALYPEQSANSHAMKLGLRWPQQKTDEDGLRAIREAVELEFYRITYKFLPPSNFNDYTTWADVIATPGPRSLEMMEEWLVGQDKEIQVVSYDPYKPLDMTQIYESTQWVVFVQDSAKISPEIIGIFSAAINDMPDAKLIYADHDYIDPQNNKRVGHDFKPHFDLHLFLGRDYITPVFMIRREELSIVSPEAAGSALYAQVWNLIFRDGRAAIKHVPYVLAHLALPRIDDLAKLTVNKAEIASIAAKNLGLTATVEPHPVGMGLMLVSYKPTSTPKVSIIVPTKNKVEMLEPCLATVLKMTTYPNFEVIVVDNGSTRPEMLAYQAKMSNTDKRLRFTKWDHPYNWSKLNNWAASQVDGEFVIFLNDDTRVLSPHWIEEMVGAALCPGVGAVGAKLVYPHGAIQHIGVIAHRGINGHIHKGQPVQSTGYHGLSLISHEATAVTGACLLVRRQLFHELGGFDETLANNFNDVAFCLEVIHQRGLVNVVANHAELQHLEGVTRVTAATEDGKKILIDDGVEFGRRYRQYADPYFNPNLQITAIQDGMMIVGLNMDILNWIRAARPWIKNDDSKRVLYVGDISCVMPEKRDGASVYELSVVGYQAVVTNPIMENVKAFDIRDPQSAQHIVNSLGIDEVLVSSIRNTNLDVLSFLTRLGKPVTYRPVDAESICPQHDLKPKGVGCERGWVRGACQTCIDTHGSPHGYVSALAWISTWVRFLTSQGISVDLSILSSEEFSEAIREVYKNGEQDVRAA